MRLGAVILGAALGLGLLALTGPALAVKAMPESEAHETCTYWASTYRKLAEFRDAGLAQKALLDALDRAEVQKKISPDYARALRAAIRAVYANPSIPPKDIASLVFEKCMADLTLIRT